MIFVDKGPCPQEIQEDIDAQKAKDGWDEIPEIPNAEQAKRLREEFFDALNKTRIRTELLKRQHGLCVYCMTRVENNSDSAVIEHLYPLSKSKQRALQYVNLFVRAEAEKTGMLMGIAVYFAVTQKKKIPL